MSRARYVEAFGECKRIYEWARDPRCAVDDITLRNRLAVAAWPPELAIITPAHSERGMATICNRNDEIERASIREAVEKGAPSGAAVARILGISYEKIKRHLHQMDDGEQLRALLRERQGR